MEKNIQEQEDRKAKYEADKAEWKAKKLELENLVGKKNDEIFELQKKNEQTEKERNDWKEEAHQRGKVYQNEKKTKEQTDFLTELAKLQEKKGIQLDTNN